MTKYFNFQLNLRNLKHFLNKNMEVIKSGFTLCQMLCMIPFRNVKKTWSLTVIKSLTAIFATLFLILIFIVIVPFIFWRAFLVLYLRVKHSEDFVKVLDVRSVNFFFTEQHTMKLPLYIKCDNVSHCVTEIRNATRTILEEVVEYSCEFKKCLGYYYLLKKPVNIEKAFSAVSISTKEILSDLELNTYVAKCEINNNQLFQVKWIKESLDENTYVLVILVHHCISDGHSVLGVVHKYLFDEKFTLGERNIPLMKSLTLNEQFISARYFKGNIFDDVLLPCTNILGALFSEKDTNCVPKLKALRRKLRCGFNELAMSLVTYSLFEYMKKHLGECPRTFSIVYIRMFDRKHTKAGLDGIFPQDRPANHSISVQLQFDNLDGYRNFYEFHEHIAAKYKQSINSMASEMTFYSVNYVLDYLPVCMYSAYTKRIKSQVALIFSNIGVIRGNTIFGYPLVGCPMGMGHMFDAGMFTAFCTYDGKLQVHLGAKLHFLKSGNELQTILDSFIANIHQLYDEMQMGSTEEKL